MIAGMPLRQFHVFLASPGGTESERHHVRSYFQQFNRSTALLFNSRFEIVDSDGYASGGVGRAQALITSQTLERFRSSLALVIGIMSQRFGTPTGEAGSGTEEEFRWALRNNQEAGFPEIKWFFRRMDSLHLPPDPAEARLALDQWEKVYRFRETLKSSEVMFSEYADPDDFRSVLDRDLTRWLTHPQRPWIQERALPPPAELNSRTVNPPVAYYHALDREFRRLDIAGIDNERSFEIPLNDIYIRLRVSPETTEGGGNQTTLSTDDALEINAAFAQRTRLVIVGDPGTGKSTFLRFLTLTLARSHIKADPKLALEQFSLDEPVPIPIYLSCWDLADFASQSDELRLPTFLTFISERLRSFDFAIADDEVDRLLRAGNCCLLLDGLDEVSTEGARAAVSRLIEECVDRFGSNRFVVTSRVRAYTGNSILRGAFTRFDVLPLDSADRRLFLRNWFALLFRTTPERVTETGSDANREIESLSSAIERNERIRSLAINPLLLTVIAIVHWNRKRLPEQRIDLYEECVDVLLGQRKEAERIQRRRRVYSTDDTSEHHSHEERARARKRLAEIALYMTSQSSPNYEVTQADLVQLLAPRFTDPAAMDSERAAIRVGLFLESQELRVGLLVSRRAKHYRFVHLTFQEYLTAWYLSNMDLAEALKIVRPHLGESSWFETLQLLGSQWAKESDERLDTYVSWLLESRGDSLQEQAPLVALCANILRDTSAVADIRAATRSTYAQAVANTLHVFREGSEVPIRTQMEILEALGALGAPVKPHLTDALRANFFQVRRRAVELVAPLISDDELFSFERLLSRDRSKEPIRALIKAWLARDSERTLNTLKRRLWGWKAGEAVATLAPLFRAHFPTRIVAFQFVVRTARGWNLDASFRKEIQRWIDDIRIDPAKREETRRVLIEAVDSALHPDTRAAALEALAKYWHSDEVRALIAKQIRESLDYLARRCAVDILAEWWQDEDSRKLIEDSAISDRHPVVRSACLEALAKHWPDEATRGLLRRRGTEDFDWVCRVRVLDILSSRWPDRETQSFLIERALGAESHKGLRIRAFLGLFVRLDWRVRRFAQALYSQNSDSQLPFLDPRQPITRARVRKAAESVTLSPDQIDEFIMAISQHLGWDVILSGETERGLMEQEPSAYPGDKPV